MRMSDWSSDVYSSDLIEHESLTPRTRPSECDRVGAENRFCTSRRRHPGVTRRESERDQPLAGQSLDLRPQRREMNHMIERQRRDALIARFLHEQRTAAPEGELREAPAERQRGG